MTTVVIRVIIPIVSITIVGAVKRAVIRRTPMVVIVGEIMIIWLVEGVSPVMTVVPIRPVTIIYYDG
jgi:hypothetical protein